MTDIILPDRKTEIQGILSDLESLQADAKYGEAAKLNAEFFKAIRSPLTYVRWLIFRAPKLRRNRSQIVEIGDLPLERWQKSGLEVLSGFEAIAGASLHGANRELNRCCRKAPAYAEFGLRRYGT